MHVSSYQNGILMRITLLISGLRRGNALESTMAGLNIALILVISLNYLRPRADRICIVIIFTILVDIKLMIYFGSRTTGCSVASESLGLEKLRLILIQ